MGRALLVLLILAAAALAVWQAWAPSEGPGPVERGTPSEAELRAICARHHGNVTAIAKELGKERMQIHRWLKRYGIDIDSFRSRG